MRPDASTKIAKVTPKAGPNPVIIGAVVAALVIIAVVVAIVLAKPDSSGPAGAAEPAGVVGGTGGGILVNATAAKPKAPTLDLYEDFQCPSCARLEELVGAQVTAMAKAGDIKLVVHTLSFLDDNLKNDSSARSANAAACASDAGKYLPYHATVFAAQPQKEGEGYTDAQLTEFAKTSGIAPGPALTKWQQCTNSGQHDQYVTEVQEASDKAGITGTPTVKLNGKDITKSLTSPDALPAAVKAATS
jgi:protein-disulfide isomerase